MGVGKSRQPDMRPVYLTRDISDCRLFSEEGMLGIRIQPGDLLSQFFFSF